MADSACQIHYIKKNAFKNNNIELVRKLVSEGNVLQINNLEIDRKVSLYGAEAVLSFVGLTSSSDAGSICVRSAVLESHMR